MAQLPTGGRLSSSGFNALHRGSSFVRAVQNIQSVNQMQDTQSWLAVSIGWLCLCDFSSFRLHAHAGLLLKCWGCSYSYAEQEDERFQERNEM